MRRILSLALVVLVVSASPAWAQVKDLAELFPPHTKAYLEVNQVADLVKELRPLLKGSCLEDMPGSLEKLWARAGVDLYAPMMRMSFFAAPEMLAEAGRLKGGAIALTKLSKDAAEDPEFLAVLLTGDSHMPTLFARMMLTMLGSVKTVAEVEGVRLYRPQRQMFRGGNPQPTLIDMGPTVALAPGAIVVGSSTADVTTALRRLKGKNNGASLAGVASFQHAAPLRKQPGLFAYGEVETLVNLGRMLFESRPLAGKRPPDPFDKAPTKVDIRSFIPPGSDRIEPAAGEGKGEAGDDPLAVVTQSLKGFRSIAVGLTIKNGAADMRGLVAVDPKMGGALPEFFTARTVNLDLLRYAPKASPFAVTWPMPDGSKFWDKLGKTAPAFETFLSLTLGSAALDKIVRVAVFDSGAESDPGPVWLLEAKDEKAATELVTVLTKNLDLAGAAKDRIVVLGRERQRLTSILKDGAANKGLLADAKIERAAKDHDGAHVLAVYSMSQTMVSQLKRDAERTRKMQPRPEFRDKFDFKDKLEQVALQDEPLTPQQRQAKELDRLAAELAKALEPVPPFVLSFTKKDEQIVFRGGQAGLQTAVPRIIDALLEWNILSAAARYRGFNQPPPVPLDKPK